MKPKEFANLFSEYLEESTTPQGVKIQAFFNNLTASQKRIVANNVKKAYASYMEEEKEKAELKKQNKKEIAELKKRAKALGLTIT